MIEGVIITPLKQIPDERGTIMHMLKSTDPAFTQFGEIYFSGVYPDVVKAWHIHTEMTLNYAVPIGKIKFVLYDDRPKSSTFGEVQELFIGSDNYCLVTVPPNIWNGFKGCGTEMSLVANCASIPHDPNEISRLDPIDNHIPYDWALKHK
jgi:dTDP-4-dehydrorhamnose 3,5-epimerase